MSNLSIIYTLYVILNTIQDHKNYNVGNQQRN